MFPTIKLQGFKGQGTIQEEALKTEFEYGVKSSRQRNQVKLSYKLDYGEKTFSEIIEGIAGHVPDISFDEFCYMENNLRLGPNQPNSVLCIWKRESIQTNKIQNMIVNGSKPYYPNEDIVKTISEIKNMIADLPEEVISRFRPSFMTMQTKPDINNDEWAVKALRIQPYMLFIKERNKSWIIRDWEYKTRG